MAAGLPLRLACGVIALGLLAWSGLPGDAAGQDTRVPQTALSLCPALTVVSREDVPIGTAIAVSPDGRRLARYIHTTLGAELKIRDRETGEERRARLDPPQLPPGFGWQIHGVTFSATGELVAVRSVGAIWVLAADTAEVRYQVSYDAEKQAYPGKASLAGGQLAVSFWLPESYLADAVAKKPVEVRFYEAASGKLLRSISLALDSANQWTEIVISPDATRLAILLRATRWPGRARLALFAAEDGKVLWERKIGAEDLAWSSDGKSLIVLGGELSWLDAATGNKRRGAERTLRFSESQSLRASEAGKLAVGQFSRYNPIKRGLNLDDRRDSRVLVWRLDPGRALCELTPRESEGSDVWPTSGGELLALEQRYEVRPPLRLLRGAVLVTYRLNAP